MEQPSTTAARITEREGGLHKALTKRQVTMIALGGAIGTGLFMGSGIAIGYAGPAVLISYAIAALIAVIMILSLAEMAVAHPTAGSFGTYAEMYLSRWAGFVVRYTYWIIQVVAIGGEAIAVGLYMGFWFPDIAVWMWSLAFGLVLVYVNCRSVANFGVFEYWFAMIKVAAIMAFIVIGLAYLFGIGTGTSPVGMQNLTGLPGGFMPHGWGGVWMAVLIAIFSFYGVEIIAVASGETQDPRKTIPLALRSLVLRLTLFYVLALGIMVAFIPWTEVGVKIVQQSPFVKLFEHAGIRHAAGIMNFVVITAALSSMNTNIYLCSRMLFSLGRGGYAPAFVGKLGKRGTPLRAILHRHRLQHRLLQRKGVQPAFRYRHFWRHFCVDHDPCHASALSPCVGQGHTTAGAYAVFPLRTDTGHLAAVRGAHQHGAERGLGLLLDDRRTVAGDHFAGVLCLAAKNQHRLGSGGGRGATAGATANLMHLMQGA